MKMKDLRIRLGSIRLEFRSKVPLVINEGFEFFLDEQEGISPDIVVFVRKMDKKIIFDNPSCGEDLLLRYYRNDDGWFAAAKEGTKDTAVITKYDSKFTTAVMYLNDKDFPGMLWNVAKLLQLFPIRQFLIQRNIFVLHSSRILYQEKAILFTAPSKVGKSTQAQLWNKYEGAKVISNDRTLIEADQGLFITYNFIVDGSAPVFGCHQAMLGAVVVLRQANQNKVTKLVGSRALKYMIEQCVFDSWEINERIQLQLLLLQLIERYPVYLLECRPDEQAVHCLKQRLIRDGVFENEN